MRLHGVPAEQVSQQLGHLRLGTTGIYTEYDPEYLKAACASLDALLRKILPSYYSPSDPGGTSRWWMMPGVATGPEGDSTLTAMPSSHSSAARPVVNRSNAALHMP